MAEVGGIFRAIPMNPGRAALVLVTALDETTQSADITLLSPDLELGGSTDLAIAPKDSGLPYSLLAESDVFGYAWVVQLDRKLGRVDARFLAALDSLRNDGAMDLVVAGPPIVQRSDPRWNFKLYELARLQQLTAHPRES